MANTAAPAPHLLTITLDGAPVVTDARYTCEATARRGAWAARQDAFREQPTRVVMGDWQVRITPA